jgi:hypothetical protein
VTGKASQAGASEHTIHKVRHTGASESFVSASSPLDYLGIIVQALCQASPQVGGLRKYGGPFLPLFPVAQNHAAGYRPYISGFNFKHLVLSPTMTHQYMEYGEFPWRVLQTHQFLHLL